MNILVKSQKTIPSLSEEPISSMHFAYITEQQRIRPLRISSRCPYSATNVLSTYRNTSLSLDECIRNCCSMSYSQTGYANRFKKIHVAVTGSQTYQFRVLTPFHTINSAMRPIWTVRIGCRLRPQIQSTN